MKKTLKFYLVMLITLFSINVFSAQLFVITPNNGTITLDVEPSDSFENIKAKIFTSIGVLENTQLLSFNGAILNDGQTLADLNIGNNQTILLTIKSGTVNIGNNSNVVTSGNVTINVKGGTFINNGTMTNNNGALAFSAPVTFLGTGTTNTKNLVLNHTGTSDLYNRIQVSGNLQVNNGNLNANNNLTLISNPTQNAVIAPVPLGSNITGKVTVQRYIPMGKRAFRFLSPGVTTDNFISNNWQLATHITGSTSGANGFDLTQSGAPSMFVYNNQQASGSGWMAIANTNATNLLAGQGYRLLIRGDREPNNINLASQPLMNTAITLAATGTVTTGTVQMDMASNPAINNTTNTITNGFSLIGNPYVNTVNWNDLNRTGLTDAYYAWDANMGTPLQRGRYVVYSATTGSNNIASAINQYIQPGQAFFVKNEVVGTPGSIIFQENNKVGGNTLSNQVFSLPAPLARVDLQIFDANEATTNSFPIDAAVAVFGNQFTNQIEAGDVEKLSTGTENIAFLNNTTALAIEARPLVTPTDELAVQLQQFQANKNYMFRTHFNNFEATVTPYLWDTYLNQYIALALDAPSNTAFTTTNDAASYASDRFKIVFQNTALNNPDFTANQIAIYPNPVTNNRFNISLPNHLEGEVQINISNALGQIIYKTQTNGQPAIEVQINQQLAEGIYMVQIQNQGKTINKKIAIKN